MLTVGLAKELYYIAHTLNTNVDTTVILNTDQGPSYPLRIFIAPNGKMDVWYLDQLIWSETIEGESSFFGVESCDSIARIITCINNNSSWEQHRWAENLDKMPKP